MGRSGSSSQANQSTSTSNQDNRVTNRDGTVLGAGAMLDASTFTDARMNTNLSSWDSSNRSTTTTTTNNTLDGGAIDKAFDFAKASDATSGAVMADVLGLADRLSARSTDSATNLAARYQADVLQAFDGARMTTPGGIDNKTMIVLAVAGAVAVMASKRS